MKTGGKKEEAAKHLELLLDMEVERFWKGEIEGTQMALVATGLLTQECDTGERTCFMPVWVQQADMSGNAVGCAALPAGRGEVCVHLL